MRILLVPSLLFVGVIACGNSETAPPLTPDNDAGATDATPDLGAADLGFGEDAASIDAGTEDLGAPADATVDAGIDSGVDGGPRPDAQLGDPFAPQPDESEGLVNVSTDLEALLENGALEGACADYEADPTDRRKMLLCGKSMFFYESFGTVGVPQVFIEFFAENFPEVGSGWTEYGMVPDPYSTTHRPLGFGDAPPLGNAPTLAFTCASCHFGQLEDGRYAVGAPNHRYEYGKMIATIMLVPALVSPNADPAAHDPSAVAVVQPILDRVAMDRPLRLRLLLALLPLAGSAGMAAAVTPEVEGHYARWLTGTMDFVVAPLPVDDEVMTISKIIALWGIPKMDERDRAGMIHAMLAWTGTAQSLEQFLEGFAILGSGDLATWTPDKLRPLAEYVYSLRAPENLTPPAADAVARGRQIFEQGGCLTCHQGPRGAGLNLYSYEEIGTDAEMKRWIDPELDGTPCCGLASDAITQQLKSPRLNGLHAMSRFLHNGSVPSLEDLLCLNGPRGDVTEPAYGNAGHTYGCERSEAERQDLIAFLRSL